MNNTYTTRGEAIDREIVGPLGEYANDFDIEAIADAVLGDFNQGYACRVTPDEFWAIAARHTR